MLGNIFSNFILLWFISLYKPYPALYQNRVKIYQKFFFYPRSFPRLIRPLSPFPARYELEKMHSTAILQDFLQSEKGPFRPEYIYAQSWHHLKAYEAWTEKVVRESPRLFAEG